MIKSVARSQEMVRENLILRGKTQGILFSVRENWHIEEITSGKINLLLAHNTTEGWRKHFQVSLISAKFFLLVMESATTSDISHFLVREIWLLSRKSQRIMKTDVCGNYDQFLVNKAWKMAWFGSLDWSEKSFYEFMNSDW